MKESNLPAFANPGSDQGPGSSGLTKREYFAAMAMQGLAVTWNQPNDHDHVAHLAVLMADATIKELEK